MSILFFAHDPGGANAIVPLIQPLAHKQKLNIFAKGPACNILPYAQTLPSYIGDDTAQLAEQIAQFLHEQKPSLIITGTSAHDFTEKYIWKCAEKLKIPSIALLDHWVNYGLRFSKWTAAQKHHFSGICDFLPTYIIVMDAYAKEEMAQEGVPAERIFPLGNPHFEQIIKNTPKNDLDSSQRQRIVFASEPLMEDYGQGGELMVAEALCHYVQDKNMECVIRLHPREHREKYAPFAGHKVSLDQHSPAATLIASAHVVVSQSSMFLIEAALRGKACISYQPHVASKEHFILTKKGELPFINTKSAFFEELDAILLYGKTFQYALHVNTSIIKNIIDFIEEILWQNSRSMAAAK